MTYDTYRFSFGRQRSFCPRCGHRDFKPYIDMATGNALDVNVSSLPHLVRDFGGERDGDFNKPRHFAFLMPGSLEN